MTRARGQRRRARIALCLSHTGFQDRLARIRPQIAAFADHLAPDCGVAVLEAWHQPELGRVSLWAAIRREVAHHAMGDRWKRYLGIAPRSWPRRLWMACDIAARFALGTAAERSERRIRPMRHIANTDKHITLWTRALEAGADLAIVFEDDAVFRGESNAHAARAVEAVLSADPERPFYADLAGGLDFDGLWLRGLVTGEQGGIARLSKPASNTSCCYLVNRAGLEILRKVVFEDPSLRTLNSDWLLNAVFMRSVARGDDWICLHHLPPVLDHGSLSGAYTSQIARSEVEDKR